MLHVKTVYTAAGALLRIAHIILLTRLDPVCVIHIYSP